MSKEVSDGLDVTAKIKLKGTMYGKANGLSWFTTALFIVADMAGGGVVAIPIAMLQSGTQKIKFLQENRFFMQKSNFESIFSLIFLKSIHTSFRRICWWHSDHDYMRSILLYSTYIGRKLGDHVRTMARVSGALPKTLSRNGIQEYGSNCETVDLTNIERYVVR